MLLLSLPQVETIGDAYMVVGGLPESNPNHAEDVANQALDMMHYCKQVTRPDKKEPITVRERPAAPLYGMVGEGKYNWEVGVGVSLTMYMHLFCCLFNAGEIAIVTYNPVNIIS